jgi:DNA-binding transcriptional ArsR family regulator
MPSALDARLAALADPTRRAILDRLARGEAAAGDLVALVSLAQPTVSHHLKVLVAAGLIEARPEGTRRVFRLAPDALAPLRGWLDGLARSYDRLDALLGNPTED